MQAEQEIQPTVIVFSEAFSERSIMLDVVYKIFIVRSLSN